MPKSVWTHANERIDKEDLDQLIQFPKDLSNVLSKYRFLDRHSRILQGFRVEIPDQAQFPGRIVVHGGVALQRDGQLILNEDELNSSKTVTLEGSGTTFYVEVEFVETESDVDARAFWDPTVDQGLDASGDALPDGQEFSANVATRKTPGWRVVTPISTTGFARDKIASLDSNNIPLIKIATDATNQLLVGANTNLLTEKAASTQIESISTTQMRVQNPRLFLATESISITDDAGVSVTTITSVDYETGLVETPIIVQRAAGAIVRVTSLASPDFIIEESIGRYRRLQLTAAAPGQVVGHRDMLFRGDEIHGQILSQGHTSAANEQNRSDVNLQSLKDHVDYLTAQIQEMKWGVMDPHVSMTDAVREPPGVNGINFPPIPRSYHRAGGIAPARAVTITVGDGDTSFGDFNGTDEVALQAAHDALPAEGGRIFIKHGIYEIGTSAIPFSVAITNPGTVVIESEKNDTVFRSNAGFYCFIISGAATTRLILKNLTIQHAGGTHQGIQYIGNSIDEFQMHNCTFYNAQFLVNNTSLPYPTAVNATWRTIVRDCTFTADHVGMAALPLVEVTAAGGVISGMWDNCHFDHFTAAGGMTGTCINASASGAAGLTFNNCNFLDTGGVANTDVVNLGGVTLAPTNIVFSTCEFSSVATVNHIQIGGVAGIGYNLKVLDCTQLDSVASLLHVRDMDGVIVSGCTQSYTAFGSLGLQFDDCRWVKITNCDLRNGGTVQGTQSPIIVRAIARSVTNVIVSDNAIQGDIVLDNTVGVLLDSQNAQDFSSVKIVNNQIKTCEIGIAFRSTDASAGSFSNISVLGNEISDTGISVTVAANMKLGIHAGSTFYKNRWSIKDNQIVNVNPGNVTTILGVATRRGIDIQGVAGGENFSIDGNTIVNVGSIGFEVGTTTGIRLDTILHGTVSGNNINIVVGTDAAGIRLSSSTNTVDNTSCSGNTIEGVISTGAGQTAYGIVWGSTFSLAIEGNVFETINAAGGGGAFGAAIRADQAAAGTARTISIIGNVMQQLAANTDGIFISGNDIDQIVISGNTARGGTGHRRSIVFESNVAGIIRRISITGNSMKAEEANVIPNLGLVALASNVTGFSITGNTFLVTDADSDNLSMDTMDYFSIHGNFLENTGIHTGAFGSNIHTANATRFTIMGNTLDNTIANGKNIFFDAASLIWSCVGNLCNGAAESIDYVASGVGADQGCGVANLVDTAAVPDAGPANAQGITMVAGQAITQVTPY